MAPSSITSTSETPTTTTVFTKNVTDAGVGPRVDVVAEAAVPGSENGEPRISFVVLNDDSTSHSSGRMTNSDQR